MSSAHSSSSLYANQTWLNSTRPSIFVGWICRFHNVLVAIQQVDDARCAHDAHLQGIISIGNHTDGPEEHFECTWWRPWVYRWSNRFHQTAMRHVRHTKTNKPIPHAEMISATGKINGVYSTDFKCACRCSLLISWNFSNSRFSLPKIFNVRAGDVLEQMCWDWPRHYAHRWTQLYFLKIYVGNKHERYGAEWDERQAPIGIEHESKWKWFAANRQPWRRQA